jgi:hypothetical protein
MKRLDEIFDDPTVIHSWISDESRDRDRRKDYLTVVA